MLVNQENVKAVSMTKGQQMGKYFLVGIPGAGKSTLGEKVAEKLQLPFFDTDMMTINRLNIEHPAELLRFSSMERFYHGQYDVVEQLEEHEGPAIIATGAEVALMPACVAVMKRIGTIIYVERSVEKILVDFEKTGRNQLVWMRVLPGGEEIPMESRGIELYHQEVPMYKAVADLVFENQGTEEEGVRGLAELINREMN